MGLNICIADMERERNPTPIFMLRLVDQKFPFTFERWTVRLVV